MPVHALPVHERRHLLLLVLRLLARGTQAAPGIGTLRALTSLRGHTWRENAKSV